MSSQSACSNVSNAFIAFVLLLCLNYTARGQDSQFSSLFIETSIERQIYTAINYQPIFNKPIRFSPVYKVGYGHKKNKTQLEFYADVRNFKEVDLVWNTNTRPVPQRFLGPNYIYSVGFGFGKELINLFNSKILITPVIGSSIGYIPVNKDDMNSIPSDSSRIGETTYYGIDSSLLFNMRRYSRFVSDVMITGQLSLDTKFILSKRLSISLIPHYSQGLVKILESDFWYNDFTRAKRGHATLSSRGSSLGVKIRLTVQLN